MKTFQLVFGWLFLAGFTAVGTFYALDEADHRMGLTALNLHQKVGVVRYAAVQLPGHAQAPGYAQPPNQQPPNYSQPPNQQPPAYSQPPNQQPPNYSQPSNQQPPNYSQPPNQRPPTYSQPPPSNSRPALGLRSPITVGSSIGLRNPVVQPPSGQPRSGPPPAQQADYLQAITRYTEVKSRTDATARTWDPIRQSLQRQGQSLRPEIQTALSAMIRFTNQAHNALQMKNIGAAHQLMDEAEKQMALLQKFHDE